MKPIKSLRDYWIRQQRLQSSMERLRYELQLFQKKCTHKKTRFQADPSGGNDSYDVCLICDKPL